MVGDVHPACEDDEHDGQQRPTFVDHGLSTWNHGEAGEMNVFPEQGRSMQPSARSRAGHKKHVSEIRPMYGVFDD